MFTSGDPVPTHAGFAGPFLAVDDHDDNGKMNKRFETAKVKLRNGEKGGTDTTVARKRARVHLYSHRPRPHNNKHMMPCEPAVEKEEKRDFQPRSTRVDDQDRGS